MDVAQQIVAVHPQQVVSFCTTTVYSTAQTSSDNLPSYPSDSPDNSSDVVYCRRG